MDGLIKFPRQNKELDLAVDYGAVQSGIGNLTYTAMSKNPEQQSKYAICCTAEGKSSSVVMRGNFIEP